MTEQRKHYITMMERLNYPKEAKETLLALREKIEGNGQWEQEFEAIEQNFLYPEAHDLGDRLEELKTLAEKAGMPWESLHMVFLLDCSYVLLDRYHEKGIAEEVFWESMEDLYCKLMECYTVRGIWGTFVGWWYRGFFDLTLFKLGRLEFEWHDYSYDAYTVDGVTLEPGMKALNMHIPSCGPLKKEDRMDSYKKACKFFTDGKPVFMMCSSWLLYPEHENFLPEGSNIVSFLRDFDIVSMGENEQAGDMWRVFGNLGTKHPENLPEDTGLRRAYKKRLCSGGKTGHGVGVFYFDGEHIHHQDGSVL